MPKNPQIKIVTLLKRKAGMSREDFVRYYESRHAVLATRVVPGLVDYRRMFVDAERPAFGMAAESPGFDVITTLVFADEAAYQHAFQTLTQAEIAQRISADEANLFDTTCIRAYLVDEYISDLS